MSALKVAVIGAGRMGALHASKLAALDDVALSGIVDIDQSRAASLAGRFECDWFTNCRDALRGADAAIVAVPPDQHAKIASACLDRGVHVLLEKPIAANIAEADELVRLASQCNTVLQVAHVERFRSAFRSMHECIDQPLFIDAERLASFDPRARDVDVVLDLMIHDIDLALSLVKRDVVNISACGFGVLTTGIDIAHAYLEFDNGCVANLAASRVSQSPVRKYRVFQHNLYVSADLDAGRMRLVRRDGARIEQQEQRFDADDALAQQDKAFVAAVRGLRPVAVTAEQGRQALAVALRVGQLARERLDRFHMRVAR
ncbi:MAG TPA: Gfo/Idh/MocA family oxidoreductase [Casimicrobiaceae bacterium]|nr:Gfo/Idh/MocA family oxidoreductase [Casimicrobiaceae bacterium]